MNLIHLTLDQLKPDPINVRKKGGKHIDDLVPSIRALGLVQPLLVRPNCEGYEIIAGQRRYHALSRLAEEGLSKPVPCLVMEDGDDAKALEASLAENLARLPMDEIDQYRAFAALIKQDMSVSDIASHFGVSERLVNQRLAIANLHGPVLTAYRNGDIGADTLRHLTLASKRQQKAWWDLFKDEQSYAPLGYRLKDWLFGGAQIPVENALFDETDYDGSIISDLFGDQRYFDDAEKFWVLQNHAIAALKETCLEAGWSAVELLDVGAFFPAWDYVETAKKNGGQVFIQIAQDGEVTCHKGYLTAKQAKRLRQSDQDGSETEAPASRPELTKAMQNYLDLHRHAAVRFDLLSHQGLALRVATAQILAGSELWRVSAEPQRADKPEIAQSLELSDAQIKFEAERNAVRELLATDRAGDRTSAPRSSDHGRSFGLLPLLVKLTELDDGAVTRIFTFAVTDCLPSGSILAETLGQTLGTNMADYWSPDQTFLDLMKDKEAINVMVKELAGKTAADAHVTSTAKVQKNIIRDCLEGVRDTKAKDWMPRYMEFPMRGYTKRSGIEAIERGKQVRAALK